MYVVVRLIFWCD